MEINDGNPECALSFLNEDCGELMLTNRRVAQEQSGRTNCGYGQDMIRNAQFRFQLEDPEPSVKETCAAVSDLL